VLLYLLLFGLAIKLLLIVLRQVNEVDSFTQVAVIADYAGNRYVDARTYGCC
jgi:hypothetical protein